MQWRPPLSGHRPRLALLAGASGLAMLAVGYAVDDGSSRAWWSGVLVNGGTAVLLFSPLYFLTERLGRRIEGVRQEAREQVGTLTDRVESFERDVDRRLDDVGDAVRRRLAQERERDASAFAALGDSLTRESVFEALRRAAELELIGLPGPRVPIHAATSDVFLRFDYRAGDDRDEESLWIAVDLNSQLVSGLYWEAGEPADEVMTQLGRQTQVVESRLDLDVPWLMRRLRDTLQAAAECDAARPIRQLCPPQWAVTDRGITVYSHGPGEPTGYSLTRQRFRELFPHVAAKPWAHAESLDDAWAAASAMLPEGSPWDDVEPPF